MSFSTTVYGEDNQAENVPMVSGASSESVPTTISNVLDSASLAEVSIAQVSIADAGIETSNQSTVDIATEISSQPTEDIATEFSNQVITDTGSAASSQTNTTDGTSTSLAQDSHDFSSNVTTNVNTSSSNTSQASQPLPRDADLQEVKNQTSNTGVFEVQPQSEQNENTLAAENNLVTREAGGLVDSNTTVIVGLEGTYLLVDTNKLLERINAIRLEAYKEDLVSSYLPLRWSYHLERIAETRAAEATVKQSHTRPNDYYTFSTSDDNFYASAENLAWNFRRDTSSTSRAIEQFYEEKTDYLTYLQTGYTPNQIGHYVELINPIYKYIGISTFYAN